jgi:Phosphatidate cytidylyltransferase, mitochondrial
VLDGVSRAVGVPVSGSSAADAAALAGHDSAQIRAAVLATVAAIVSRSSLRQSVKGLATAGVWTSVRYVAAKVSKALAAKQRLVGRTRREPLAARKFASQ